MKNVAEKSLIAKLAVQHIRPGDRIALDASTTAWQVALELPNVQLTVLTNSLQVAYLLRDREQVEVISTGGILQPKSLSFIGPLAEETMSSFYVNKAFISCEGFHTEYGLSESNPLQAQIKQKMIEIAEEVYLLADHTKIQVRNFVPVAPLSQIDTLITDSQVSHEYVDELRRLNIEVLQASFC
ncbi:DeoR/GlpR family DNA-binding transcription regulator [Alicyclobacillus fastidiosus]|uniref:DeoR/GlpR transcriptional regulator n=1 Tax=Alicyclobacillus fastidiosus TaxID=392011 RepID=A0ABV5AIQ2_9BACL|nr:DeoR/GlpR transcriptional regulator [Alicyclobacillus fastidiosus]WEH07794.1 DeoR/GlpR transcriptional regulator [Alicyclobacillus fastidiosus]